MIVVTGAGGFIGSCLVSSLNFEGFKDIVAVDKFDVDYKRKNLENHSVRLFIDRSDLFDWIKENHQSVEFIFHLGARTDTAEFDTSILSRLNTEYSKEVWRHCVEFQIPVVYASSAATYGLGELGYKDDVELIPGLKPLNPYGDSKNEFDIWALQQTEKPFFWAGLKFFNVYGPNEYHKKRMASVVFHAYNQIKETGRMRLFRSHNPQFKDGEQLRDFIYVKDVTDVCLFLMHHRKNSSIYNLGTGQARTFLDLTSATFRALNMEEDISFIDTPIDIRDKYQYFTEADMSKLRSIGYQKEFMSIEDGVSDYVENYLIKNNYL